MNNNLKVYKTKDGSNTLKNLQLNEIYHSRNGAITESLHVFIENGFNYFLDKNIKSINVFEVGFGTGLNAILTLKSAMQNNINLYYEAIDTTPINWQIIEQLDYGNIEIIKNYINFYKKIVEAKWNTAITIEKNYKFFLDEVEIAEKKISNKFNLIYFDAFAPNIQESMWTESGFKKMYNCLINNGILVTYCAKGSVKRAMQSAGFIIKKLPGPPGKREMIRAIKKQ